jgi:hypothetical protein
MEDWADFLEMTQLGGLIVANLANFVVSTANSKSLLGFSEILSS